MLLVVFPASALRSTTKMVLEPGIQVRHVPMPGLGVLPCPEGRWLALPRPALDAGSANTAGASSPRKDLRSRFIHSSRLCPPGL